MRIERTGCPLFDKTSGAGLRIADKCWKLIERSAPIRCSPDSLKLRRNAAPQEKVLGEKVMRKKKSSVQVSGDARVACRLPTEEKAALLAECEAHGITLSELIRARAVGTRLLSRIDAQAIAELRRQGEALKQLLAQSAVVDPEQVRDAVATIVATVKKIGEQAAR